MYLYLNTASIIRILSDVRQNSFTPFLYILFLFFLFPFSDRGQKYKNYILDIYIIYILYILDLNVTLLLQHFKFYLFLLFSITPPPLSSFDLLFWLGGGGAWMQKVREHASIARSEQKKIFDPWGGV